MKSRVGGPLMKLTHAACRVSSSSVRIVWGAVSALRLALTPLESIRSPERDHCGRSRNSDLEDGPTPRFAENCELAFGGRRARFALACSDNAARSRQPNWRRRTGPSYGRRLLC